MKCFRCGSDAIRQGAVNEGSIRHCCMSCVAQWDEAQTLDAMVAAYPEFQRENWGDPDLGRSVLKVGEEFGELCAALYRKDLERVEDAMADVVISMQGIASACNVDFRSAVLRTWSEVSKRDFKKQEGRS